MSTGYSGFSRRYPHGVLTEQEGGVPNDAGNWQRANHVCRKHRVRETSCKDAISDEDSVAFAAALESNPRWDLIQDAVISDDDSETAPETPQQHATTCDLLRGFGWRICNCGLNNEQDVTSLDCA